MQKIPFDIKYRPEIESGKYKVETNAGRPVRIICWDAKNEDPLVQLPIVGLVDYGKREMVFTWDIRGLYPNNDMDLVIVTDWKSLEDVKEHLINLIYSIAGEFYMEAEINEKAEEETMALYKIFKEALLPVELSKPAEWSEEDEVKKNAIADWLAKQGFAKYNGFEAFQLMRWLNSLSPQPHWKPSEEQMEALFNNAQLGNLETRVSLESLYNDLKKLM